MASCVELIKLPVYSIGNEVNPINSHTIEFIGNCTESVAVFANVQVNSSQVVKDSTDFLMASRKNGVIKRHHNRAIDLALKYRRRRSTIEDKRKLNGEVVPIQKVQQNICRVETIPGTSLKICSCGTVSETAKSKKCQNCHKFFYDHWAQRCRIPPCPKCHFCRKAKSREKPPYKCDRCGFEINAELVVSEQPSQFNEPDTEENIHPDNLSSPKPELLPTVLNILKICGNKSFEETEEKSDSLDPVEDCATCSSSLIEPNTELIEETIEESNDFTIPFSLRLSEGEENLLCEDAAEPSTPPMNSTAGSFFEDDFITTQSSMSISPVTVPTCISQTPSNQAVALNLPPLPLSPSSSSGMVSPCFSSASTVFLDHGQLGTDKTSSSYDSKLSSNSKASSDITQIAIAANSSNGPSLLVPSSVTTEVSTAQETVPLPVTVKNWSNTQHLDLLLSQNEQLMDFQNEGTPSLCNGDLRSVQGMDTLHLLDEGRPITNEYHPCVLDGDESFALSKDEIPLPIKDSLLNECSVLKANQDPVKGTNEDEEITNESTILNEEHQNSIAYNETAPSKNLVPIEDSERNQDALPILSSEEPVKISLSQNPCDDSPLPPSSEDCLEEQKNDLSLPSPSVITSAISSTYPPTQNLSPSPISSEDSQSFTCKDEKFLLPTVEVESTVSTSMPHMSTGIKCTPPNPVPTIKSVYVPSLHKIRELVGLTLKRTPIEQYQQIQRKILANQIQAQIEIQRSILKSQTGSDNSEPTSILGKNTSTLEDGKPAAKRRKNVFSDIVADVIQSIKELDKSKANEPSIIQPAPSSFSPSVSTAITTPINSKTVDSLTQSSSFAKLSLYSPLIQGPIAAEGSSRDGVPSEIKDNIPLRLSNSFRKIETTGNDKIRVSLLKDNTSSAQIDGLSSNNDQVILPSPNFCVVNAKISRKSEPSTIPLAGDLNTREVENVTREVDHVTREVDHVTREVDPIAGNYVPSLTSIKEEPTDHVTQDLNAEQAMINDPLVDVPTITATNPILPENNFTAHVPPLLKLPLIDSSTLNTHPDDSCNDAILQNTIPALPVVPSELALPLQDAVTGQSSACILSLHKQPSSSANILPDVPGNPSQVRLQVSNSILSSLKNEGLNLSTTSNYRSIRPRPTASIGGVLVQSLESRSPDQPPVSKVGGVFVSVLSSFAPPVKSQDSTIGD